MTSDETQFRYVVSNGTFARLDEKQGVWINMIELTGLRTVTRFDLRSGCWRFAGNSLLGLIEWTSQKREREELCLAI